ncbi:hypothetical protein PInf_018586 [Phytophthora infestans]|nr:hypothetical protein PInf_018586 [Phytophthora infestans]
MEEPSFVNSGQYVNDLIERSGQHSGGRTPNLSRYPSTPHTPIHRRPGQAPYNFANTPYTPRRRNASTHSVLHQTNRSQTWLADDKTRKLPIILKSVHLRECLAEFLGTFVLCVFGLGVNNQVALSKGANGSWLSINICWGIALLMGVYISRKESAHDVEDEEEDV